MKKKLAVFEATRFAIFEMYTLSVVKPIVKSVDRKKAKDRRMNGPTNENRIACGGIKEKERRCFGVSGAGGWAQMTR